MGGDPILYTPQLMITPGERINLVCGIFIVCLGAGEVIGADTMNCLYSRIVRFAAASIFSCVKLGLPSYKLEYCIFEFI